MSRNASRVPAGSTGSAPLAVRGGTLNSILPHYARQIGKIFNYTSRNIELYQGKLEFRTEDVGFQIQFMYEFCFRLTEFRSQDAVRSAPLSSSAFPSNSIKRNGIKHLFVLASVSSEIIP